MQVRQKGILVAKETLWPSVYLGKKGEVPSGMDGENLKYQSRTRQCRRAISITAQERRLSLSASLGLWLSTMFWTVKVHNIFI
jgi:hypothetical protein